MRKYSTYDFELGERPEMDKFVDFLDNNNVFTLIVASVLASRVSEMADKLVTHLLMPIFERDGDGDGEKDISFLEKMDIYIFGCHFRYGIVLVSILKLVFVAYVVYKVTSFMRTRRDTYNALRG